MPAKFKRDPMWKRAEKMIFHNGMTVTSLQNYVEPATLEAWKWIDKCRAVGHN